MGKSKAAAKKESEGSGSNKNWSHSPGQKRSTSPITKYFQISVITGAVLAAYCLKIANDFHIWDDFKHHGTEHCTAIHGALGIEDGVVYKGKAYFASDDRVKWMAIEPGDDERASIKALGKDGNGAFWSHDFSKDGALKPVNINWWRGADFEFHPHGMGIDDFSSDKVYFYVVNHRSDGDAVEVFELLEEENKVKHLASHMDAETMRNLNDVQPVGDGAFYATNWKRYDSTSPMVIVESFLRKPWAHVTYCTTRPEQQCRIVADQMAMANGIAASKDGTKIYVSATMEETVHVYHRDILSGDLELDKKIDLGTFGDNIHVVDSMHQAIAGYPDSEYVFQMAAHPSVYQFFKHTFSHFGETILPSASQVLEVNAESGEIKELYLSDGTDLSGSSCAIKSGTTTLIGSVFGDGILVCSLDGPGK